MIGRIILALIAFAVVMAVFKMAIVALVLAGLIFRTKEVAALLFFFGFLGLCSTHPWIAAGIVAVALFGHFAGRKRKTGTTDVPLLPPPSATTGTDH